MEFIESGGRPSAFYDVDAEEFIVAADLSEPSVIQEIVIAVYYVYALRQQHFDFLKARDRVREPDDAWLALIALQQGDSFLAAQRYALLEIGIDRLLQDNPFALENPILDRAPDIIQRWASMPLTSGPLFVGALFESGGWAAVNAAFANPPVSTEQILPPDKYLAGEVPVAVTLPDIARALGPTWVEISTTT